MSQLEFTLRPYDRGPAIDWTVEDKIITVQEIVLTRAVVVIKTHYDTYSFDISRISAEEFKGVIDILQKMNFDNAFKFSYS